MTIIYDTNTVRLPTGTFGTKLTRNFPTSDRYKNIRPNCTVTDKSIRLRVPVGTYRPHEARRWLVLYLNLSKRPNGFLIRAHFKLWKHRLINYDMVDLRDIDKSRLEPIFPSFAMKWLWDFIDKYNETVVDTTIIEAVKLFAGLIDEDFMSALAGAGL